MRSYHKQSGLTLIEVALAMAIILSSIPFIVQLIEDQTEDVAARAAGEQLSRVIEASRAFMLDNNRYSTAVSAATPTSPWTFNINDLRTNGYLPPGFAAANVWSQGYQMYALNPSGQNLEVFIVTTGGRGYDSAQPDFGTQIVPKAAQIAGAEGGYVATGEQAGEDPNTFIGAFGGWSKDISATAIPSPGAGHLAGMLYFEGGELGKDYLYRHDVAGSPELNEMKTVLDMDGNRIDMGNADVGGGDGEGARSVNLENREASDFSCADNDDLAGRIFYDRNEGIYLCRMGEKRRIYDFNDGAKPAVADMGVVTPAADVAKPIMGPNGSRCPSGLSPSIHTSATWMSNDSGSSEPMAAFQTWANDNGSDWTVHARALDSTGWNQDEDTMRVFYVSSCQ